ncbi:ABC transporter ATP-binding protein [Yoonia sp. R2331]|uniref:ABC transporter ATP-binding protein n=1 Tax=Yoonia sp. R2331 TaxID=3237238 RepID=UPI0034E60C7D
MLKTAGLEASYGDFRALFGVDITVKPGQIVAIIGANGAGKTTLMRSIAGVLKNAPAQVQFRGQSIGDLPADVIMRRGIAMVPEGRRLFPSLSVEENLLIGADKQQGNGPWNLASIYQLFPILKEFRSRPATALSGGQQQMVAIGRALMSNPDLILFDEISLGLAPIVVKEIYAAMPKILSNETCAIVVEQDVTLATSIASYVYCMIEGRISLEGPPDKLSREDINNAYFGAVI